MADSTDNQSTWNIVSQQETTRQDQTGRFVPGVMIGFRTGSGIGGTVFIPDSQYTVENARRQIQERVDLMESVHGLKG